MEDNMKEYSVLFRARTYRFIPLFLLILFLSTLCFSNAFADIIIDNGAAGTSYTGTWSVSGGPSPYGTNSLFARPTATYTWSFSSQPAGAYEVFMWWTYTNTRPTNAQVDINTASGTQTVYINQQANGGKWNSLGTYSFNSQGSVTITASSQVLSGGTIAATCADAVRFVYTQPVNQLPVAYIDSIVPSPASATDIITFTGHGTDVDGTISSYVWNSSIDGVLGYDPILATGPLSEGVHAISFTVYDNNNAPSKSVTQTLLVGNTQIENIYFCDGFDGGGVIWPSIVTMLQSLGGAVQNSDGSWKYTDAGKGVTYYIYQVTSPAGMEAALREEGSHVIFNGHANYGLGATFTRTNQGRNAVKYVDDDLIVNISTDMVASNIPGLIYSQSYPNWKPIYKNGKSAIMPYDFGDPNGPPPYNYYLTYKIPGDNTLYFIERPDGSFIERFASSRRPAWDWPYGEGVPPDPNVESERQYFITNPAPYWNKCEFKGSWSWTRSTVYGGGWGGGTTSVVVYHYKASGGTGLNTATWTVVVNAPGTYDVQAAWFDNSTHATNARYTITYSGGSVDVIADQRTTPPGVTPHTLMSHSLGQYYFDKGVYTVALHDGANGRVIAQNITLMDVNNSRNRIRVSDQDFYKSHLSGGYYGSYTILSAKGVTIPNEDLKYKRLFYSSCFSAEYFLGKFNRGKVYATFAHTGGWDNPCADYLKRYLQGQTDDEIYAWINSVYPIYEFYDFNQYPPSHQ